MRRHEKQESRAGTNPSLPVRDQIDVEMMGVVGLYHDRIKSLRSLQNSLMILDSTRWVLGDSTPKEVLAVLEEVGQTEAHATLTVLIAEQHISPESFRAIMNRLSKTIDDFGEDVVETISR